MRNGGWQCKNCGKINAGTTGTCACGWTKQQSESNLKQKDEKEKRISQFVEQQNLELLKKYKELLDMGAITDTEFETKKRQILSCNIEKDEVNKIVNQTTEVQEARGWICSNCGKENTLERKSCRYCGAIKELNTRNSPVKTFDRNLADWQCTKCGTVNKCYLGRCQCGASKADGRILEENML